MKRQKKRAPNRETVRRDVFEAAVADTMAPSGAVVFRPYAPRSFGGATILGTTTITKGKVKAVVVPDKPDASSQLVRHHEAQHARHANKPMHNEDADFPPIVRSIAADVILQASLNRQPPESEELRRMLRVADWKRARVLASLTGPIAGTALDAPFLAEALPLCVTNLGRVSNLEKVFGAPLKYSVQSIVRQATAHVLSGGHGTAFVNAIRAEIAALLVPKPRPLDAPEGEEPSSPLARYDPPTTARMKQLDGLDPMQIVTLPHTLHTARTSIPVTFAADFGRRIIPKRLARAAITYSTRRLFKRRKREMGGVVLIDASGSMHMTHKQLSTLIEMAPAATIAYYCGDGETDGTLFIAGRNGRYAAEADLERPYSGNTVDYWAMKWLLAQPAERRVIVTDGGFCEGYNGQGRSAMALLIAAVGNQGVVWHRTVEDAVKAW